MSNLDEYVEIAELYLEGNSHILDEEVILPKSGNLNKAALTYWVDLITKSLCIDRHLLYRNMLLSTEPTITGRTTSYRTSGTIDLAVYKNRPETYRTYPIREQENDYVPEPDWYKNRERAPVRKNDLTTTTAPIPQKPALPKNSINRQFAPPARRSMWSYASFSPIKAQRPYFATLTA